MWHHIFRARSLDTPERRAELAKQLRDMTRLIRDDDVREAYRADFERRLEGLFAPARAGTKGRAWHRGQGRRDKRPLPPAGPGIRRPPEQGRHRQEQILLATALNHPELLAENAEALAALHLTDRELDRLRKALSDLVSLAPDLDSDDLKCHLSEQGFTPLLDSLLSREVYRLGPSARPDTPLVDARAMWHHIFRARSGRTRGRGSTQGIIGRRAPARGRGVPRPGGQRCHAQGAKGCHAREGAAIAGDVARRSRFVILRGMERHGDKGERNR
jgi:DNA primase